MFRLPSEIVRFFRFDPEIQGQRLFTLDDFGKAFPTVNMLDVFRVCTQLEKEFTLVEATSNHAHPIMGKSYFCLNFQQIWLDYGAYDFLAYGFLHIAEHFWDSIIPIFVRDERDVDDTGTGFLLGRSNLLITARHVIERKPLVQIFTPEGIPLFPEQIIVMNSNIDICGLRFANDAFEGPAFRGVSSEILEEVLAIGYPRIPGFDAFQVLQKGTVCAQTKSTLGRIVGQQDSYLDNVEYILIDSRIKGGNSGTPLINKRGFVIGMVVQSAISSERSDELESLGYGLAIPWSTIQPFATTPQTLLPFSKRADGFCTL